MHDFRNAAVNALAGLLRSGARRSPLIMGVLNVTPDSFSDGGRWQDRERALEHARDMLAAGAELIDIGGESTRPGADEVPVAEELERVLPVVEAVATLPGAAVSVDTSKAEVMRAAAAAGAAMINDVFALRRPGALHAAAELGLPVCLMHMRGEPRSMQTDPRYSNVVDEVESFLLERAAVAERAGIPRDRLCLDPGFGFGKRLEHNLDLLRALPRLAAHGYPLLAGLSRKSMLQALTGRAVERRLAGSLALALLAAQGGASIIRVHDVAETRDVLRVLEAVANRAEPEMPDAG